MKNNKLLYAEGSRIAACAAASLIYAVGMNLFIVPSSIYAGGLYGLCQVIRTLLVESLQLDINIDIASIIYYVVNVPIFIYAWIKISRRFLVRSVLTLTVMTVFLAIIPIRGLLPDDRLASCVIGAILCGASTGVILRTGSSAGGFDIIGLLIVLHRQDASVGKVNLLVNASLYAMCIFLFSIDVVIYSIIFSAVYAFAVDRVHSQNIIVEAKIITKHDKSIEQDIMQRLQRGVTKWTCVGGFSGDEGHVLCVILSKYELTQLRYIIRQYDPNAFIVLNENVHVQGNFLKKLN